MEELPGFRFHPTEEELLEFYLKQQQAVHLLQHGKKKKLDMIIPTVQLYRHEPWELPGMAPRIVDGEREWYFFVPRQKQQQQRPSRTTERGFWKATGSDRGVRCAADPKRLIGLKKTLVYYEGRAPRGTKTDWVMNEYRLPESDTTASSTCMVLCKIYRKAVSLKQMEQRVAMEELASANANATPSASHSSTTAGSTSSSSSEVVMKKEVDELACVVARPATLMLPQLEIARQSSSQPHRLQEVESEWMMMTMQEDPFQMTQLRSPWMEGCWSSPPYYCYGCFNQ